METNEKSYVQTIKLIKDFDKRVAFASVHIGDIVIRGVAVWRSPQGNLSVYLPSHRLGNGFEDTVGLPDELRSKVEADVIAAYKTADAAAARAQNAQLDPLQVRISARTRRKNFDQL